MPRSMIAFGLSCLALACGEGSSTGTATTAATTGGSGGAAAGQSGSTSAGGGQAGATAGMAGGSGVGGIGNEDLAVCPNQVIQNETEYCSSDYPCFNTGAACPAGKVCCHVYCQRNCIGQWPEGICPTTENCIEPKDCAPKGTVSLPPPTCE